MPSNTHRMPHDYTMKSHIAEIANDIAKTTDYAEISVTAICQKAHISRQTFYSYFADKLDVAMWHREMLIDEYFYKFSTLIGWNETLQMLLQNNKKTKHLIAGITHSKDNALFVEKSAALYRTFFEKELEARGCEITEEIDFQIDACAFIVCHILENWIKTDMKMPTDKLIKYLDGLMPVKLKNLLSKQVIPGTKELL